MATAQKHQFVICILTADYAASLEKRKIYEVLPDTEAGKHGHLRVIDESGEDYLYPASLFVPVELPGETEAAIIAAT
jgi:hypothetical protein